MQVLPHDKVEFEMNKILVISLLAASVLTGCGDSSSGNTKKHSLYKQTPEKFLTNIGMNPHDIKSLITYHLNDVKLVMLKSNLIFGSAIPLKDDFFKKAMTGKAPEQGYHLIDWTNIEKSDFKEKFARVVFLLNSPRFEALYDQHVNITVDSASSSFSIPRSYQAFKSYIFDKTNSFKNKYSFYTSDSKTSRAWGQNGLTMYRESGIGSPLLAHEMMHAVGFEHLPHHDGAVNNIPYFVQTIIGYNEDATNACKSGGNSCHFKNMSWGESYVQPPHLSSTELRNTFGLRGYYFNY